ncbi:MAG: LysM domain-containing protein [Pseudohongiellaceae bacterium]|nr:LysM domain-containing protein [Pseudohongiellaceae bacterium]
MKLIRLKSLLTFCGLSIAVLLGASAVQAQNIALSPNSPDVYVVKKGDTLWDISAMFLEEPWRWPQIWQVNPEISNPDLIFPGDSLRLIYIDGQPRIVMERGSRETVKLSPQIREEALTSAIPAISRQALQGFLIDNRIVDSDTFNSAPYILASVSGNLLMSAGHEVYVRGDWLSANRDYEIFRLGKAYMGPDKELLGQEAVSLGELSVIPGEADEVRKARIVRSKVELKAGDRLLPKERQVLDDTYFPTPPDRDMSGKVIGLLNESEKAAQFESLVLNLGEVDGLEVGDLLSISRAGETVEDPVTGKKVQLPGSEVGMVLAYKVFDKLSYGVILSLTEPAEVGQEVNSPE